jgi:hypothetical protein
MSSIFIIRSSKILATTLSSIHRAITVPSAGAIDDQRITAKWGEADRPGTSEAMLVKLLCEKCPAHFSARRGYFLNRFIPLAHTAVKTL